MMVWGVLYDLDMKGLGQGPKLLSPSAPCNDNWREDPVGHRISFWHLEPQSFRMWPNAPPFSSPAAVPAPFQCPDFFREQPP